jgi:transposase
LSQWLHRGLTQAGLDVVLMETRQVKGALKAMPIKTDRRDAEGIARLLHLGWFRPVHCKSVSAQEVRAVLNARKAVQQGFIALEMSLRGLLRNFGLKVGSISRGRFQQRIRELVAGNPMLEAATEPMLRARLSLRQELAGLERRVRQLAQEDPACRRMMSIPGVGAVVALTYRSAVDGPGRFTSSKQVGPWVGLTPSRNQSGERDVSGGITKAGDVNLRRALCQSHGHDAPWPFDLAQDMGRTDCPPPGIEARDGRAGAPHQCHSASHVGRGHGLPFRWSRTESGLRRRAPS